MNAEGNATTLLVPCEPDYRLAAGMAMLLWPKLMQGAVMVFGYHASTTPSQRSNTTFLRDDLRAQGPTSQYRKEIGPKLRLPLTGDAFLALVDAVEEMIHEKEATQPEQARPPGSAEQAA